MLDNAWELDTVSRRQIGALRDEALAGKRRKALERIAATAEAIAWREAFRGVEFRVLASGPDLTMTLMRFRRGAVAQLHHHGSPQTGYVLEGKLRVTMPGRQLTVQTGECYVLPPNVPHQIRSLDSCLVVDAFAPGTISKTLGEVAASLPLGDQSRSLGTRRRRSAGHPPAARRRRLLRPDGEHV